MKRLEGILLKVVGILVLIGLIILCFWSKPNQVALDFISSTLEESSASLVLLTELKIASASGSTVKLPLVSGSFAGVEGLLGQGMQYLEWSNILLGAQLLALTLSKSIVLKLLVLVSFLFVFLEKSRVLAVRLLIIFLLINPGLSIYTIGVKVINNETKVDLGTKLNQELKASHTKYLTKKKAHEEKLQGQKEKQLQKSEEKGKDKISFLDRIEDKVEGTAYKVEDDVSLAFNDTLAVLKAAGQKVIQLCLNLFTHIFFLFLILPLGYFYLTKYVISNLFKTDNTKTTTQNETKSN